MRHETIVVSAIWDPEAGVWSASSVDIEGLAVEAETIDLLQQKVLDAISDLIELNGLDFPHPEIPVHILAQTTTRLANPNKH